METIVREKVTYGVVLFDKYILCDIKRYPASEVQFRRLDELDKKRAKVRQYNSLKVLNNEAPHHFQMWFYNLPRLKENTWTKNKVEPWWDEINRLNDILKEAGFVSKWKNSLPVGGYGDNASWQWLIENKYIKIIKIKERLIFEE